MLRVLSRAHHVQFDNRWTKAQAVDHVFAILTNPAAIHRAIGSLPKDAREALETLVACGGAMPAHRFLDRFGPLRPYRPWRTDCPTDMWRHPISPAERLWFLGFVFRCVSPEGEVVSLPNELRSLVPVPDLEILEPVSTSPSAAYDLVLDITHLLAYLRAHAVRPLHGRWLAPRHLKRLESSLSSSDPTAATARSELQTGYVRLVHYLAKVAGLVAPASRLLKPTPAAWAWLDLSEAARLRRLWDGWRADLEKPGREVALWERFRLPGERPFVLTVFDVLTVLPSAGQVLIPALAERLDRRCTGAGTLPSGEDVETWFRRLIDGPLTWAGLVRLSDGHAIALTDLGAWMLGQTQDPPPPPPTRPASVQRVEAGLIAIRLPDPPARAPLRPLVELPLTPSERLSRHLTRERFVASLSHGAGRASVVQNLLDLTQDPLPHEVIDRLETWEQDAGRITLRQMTVMSAEDSDELTSLATQRTVRSCLNETLSPHHVAIDPSAVDRLMRALRRRGYTPLVDPGVSHIPTWQRASSSGAAAHLWLALRAYFELADVIELPSVPPAALLDELSETLDDRQLAALNTQAEEAGRRLRDALDGYTPFPAPLDGVDHEAIRATVERAIEKDSPLEIVYHTAGRGERTTRIVEPLRLEERGGATYLVAYCRLRRAERVFRVDRIENARFHTMR
jgi:hypothetical protein